MIIKRILKQIKQYREEFEINLNEMNDIIKNNDDIILLDVRSPQEYNAGHMQNAINIPLYELCVKINDMKISKSKIILVYCLSGKRSRKACKFLRKCGYQNVYNLKGGIEGN